MRKCDKCGAPLGGREQVCPACGHSCGHRYLKEQPRKKLSWIWIPAVLVLAVGIGTGALLLSGSREPQLQEPSTAQTLPPTTQQTQPPTTEETEPPTTEPPPVYRNPFNGTLLEEPYTGRPFAFTISNTPEVLPHVNVTQADIIFESFVNGSVVRMLGLYSNIQDIEMVGPIRSTRPMFNDIAQHYGLVLCHAGGSDFAMADMRSRGLDNIHLDSWECYQFGASVRDKERTRQVGYSHDLVALGPIVPQYAQEKGISLTAERDYGFLFTDDGTPEAGEEAGEIRLSISDNKYTKSDTVLTYDEATGKYQYTQYGKAMLNWITQEPEAYRNVIVIFTEITRKEGYQTTDFLTGGDGYYACGGKLIPIKWSCAGEDQPLTFTTAQGQPLEQGAGSTYIAITAPGSKLTYGPLSGEA